MDLSSKITDIESVSDVKIIECKFDSKENATEFYKQAEKHLIRKTALRNGPFFSNDENVVSVGYKPEDKEFVMEFVNKYTTNYN